MIKERKVPDSDVRGNMTEEPAGSLKDVKGNKPKWLKWFLNLVDTIFTLFS